MARTLNAITNYLGCSRLGMLLTALFLALAFPTLAQEPTQNPPPPAGEFVWAGDLKKQLQQIDPEATVEWTGTALRIEAGGQKFSLFPPGASGRQMVVNGAVERSANPLRVQEGEIYVPQAAIERIGRQLEQAGVGPAAGTPAPGASPSPSPSPSPTASPAPETTPGATATPEAAATPAATPEAAATPAPAVTPAPTPQATPTATPMVEVAPSPSPRRTRTPARTPTPAPEPAAPTGGVDALQTAREDRIALEKVRVAQRNRSQLESQAATGQVRRVIIHADDSALLSPTVRSRQAAARALELAFRVKEQLNARGIDVVMTRNDNQRVPLAKTVETIAGTDAQVLLMISVGDSEFTDVAGYRILFPSETVEYESAKDAAIRETSEEVPLSQLYRSFEQGSKVLATALAGSIQNVLKREPNGLNPAPLFLARRAPMAAALVVAGYVSNPADQARLADETQQQDLAKAIAEGIMAYSEHLGAGATR